MKQPFNILFFIFFFIAAILLAPDRGSCQGSGDEPVLNIAKTPIEPVIDGIQDPIWNFTTVQYLRNDVSPYLGLECPGTALDSLMDCNPSFRTLWNDQNIYFYFYVDDDTLIREKGTETYEDDNFELFMDTDFSHGTTYDEVNDLHVQIRWTDQIPPPYPPCDIDISKIDCIQKRHHTGWIAELSIPLGSMKMPTIENHILGLDVHYDDDDGGGCLYNDGMYHRRDHKLTWWTRGTDETWNNPSLFAKVMLGPEISAAEIELPGEGHDFGSVTVDSTGTTSLVIRNTGIDTLNITEMTTGTDAFQVDATPDEVPPGGNINTTIRFSPTETIVYTDTLIILSNAFQNPRCTFWLKGTGVVPEIERVSVLPNPFTPNEDGYNDYVSFEYPDMYTEKPHIQIFNMRGARVRDLSNLSGPETRWDGKDDQDRNLEPGVYLYILEVKNKVIGEGTITLIR